MKRILYLFLIFLLAGIQSCFKIEEDQPQVDANDLKNNEFPASFSWSTTGVISVEISGLTGLPDIKQVLVIESPDGYEYLRQLIYINRDFHGEIQLPAVETQVVVKCGKLTFNVPVSEGVIRCSLNTGSSED
ncbi:MAG: hypothetical protein AB9834_22545 [Lentimicrobium sp.]